MIESKCPEKAAQFYLSAAEVSMLENRYIQAADYSAKAAVILLKMKNYEAVNDALQKQMEYLQESSVKKTAGRVVAYMILVNLAKEDFVAAQKVFNDYKKYL